MKISRQWIQNFFETPIPDAAALADALTFHAFEIEGVEKVGQDDVLDVKVTANRGHDCLCHRGIAKELSAILNIPLNSKVDPFAKQPNLSKTTDAISVSIEEPSLCKRYIAGYIRGVKVAPSPEWLRVSLESIGQRSINNVVDATNLVMFNTGQPLHAFDAAQLAAKSGRFAIAVRKARQGEKMLALDDKEYTLTGDNLVISDANADKAVGVAGVKGGKPAGITEATKDIIIESANFDGVSVRKTAQALKLRTDASARFEQVISPELAAYGMQQVVDLIATIASGKVIGFVDQYSLPPAKQEVSVSVGQINAMLGTQFGDKDVADVFVRLGFAHMQKGEVFTVTPPFERLDLIIPEDFVEEVGRIIGYDKVPAVEMQPLPKKPGVNANFYAAEKIREELISQGYSEVFTSVFTDKGERVVANKVDGVRPYLRPNLATGLEEALERNVRIKELLGVKQVKLFEIGTVWKDGEELVRVGATEEKGKTEERQLSPVGAETYDTLPTSSLQRYQSFSRYPFIVRDISMWVPEAAESFSNVISVFGEYSQGLLRHVELFDQFKKAERVSYAFRLVFQSYEKTLTDEEVNAIMETIQGALKEKGYEIR